MFGFRLPQLPSRQHGFGGVQVGEWVAMILDDDRRERGQYDLDDTDEPAEVEPDVDDDEEETARAFLRRLHSDAPARHDSVPAVGDVEDRSDELVELLAASRSTSTIVTYRKDLSYFGSWLALRLDIRLPADRDE